MKTILLIALRALAVTLLLAGAARAQGSAPDAPKRGFLWEAVKGSQRLYLLGTIHVGRPDFVPLHVDYLKRLAEAQVIAVEADVFDARKVFAAVQKTAMYADGEPGLDTRIGAPLRKRLEALFPRFGLEAQRIWRMKPWMAGNTLTVMESTRSGLNPAYGTESFLFSFASTARKPMVEIESIERQFDIFDRAPLAMQLAYLDESVNSIESGSAEREIKRIVNAWEKHDVAAMESLVAELRKPKNAGERFVIEEVIEGRHTTMVEAIERYAASGKLHLVAVGSLHFFGPSGLLEVLRGRGFTITPLF
jgi:hypothetical protein